MYPVSDWRDDNPAKPAKAPIHHGMAKTAQGIVKDRDREKGFSRHSQHHQGKRDEYVAKRSLKKVDAARCQHRKHSCGVMVFVDFPRERKLVQQSMKPIEDKIPYHEPEHDLK